MSSKIQNERIYVIFLITNSWVEKGRKSKGWHMAHDGSWHLPSCRPGERHTVHLYLSAETMVVAPLDHNAIMDFLADVHCARPRSQLAPTSDPRKTMLGKVIWKSGHFPECTLSRSFPNPCLSHYSVFLWPLFSKRRLSALQTLRWNK